MPGEMTRWTVSVSKETDAELRSLLSQRGAKKGDLSKFVEEAVRWRVFDQTLEDARAGFDDMSPDDFESLVREAIEATRSEADKAGSN